MLHKEHPSFLTELIGESVPDMLPRRNSDTFRERHIEILREVSEPGHMYEPKRCVIERTGSIWVDALGSLHEASRSFARTKRGRALVFGLQLMSHGGSLVEMPKNLEDGLSEMVDWIDETYIEPVVEAIDEARVQLETIERTVETVDDRHERMNEAYDDAADQLRGMEHLKDQWGEQTIESMAQTIERFDVQSMWEYLAENGQLSVEQVSVNSDIRGVFVYDDLTLERMGQTYDALVESGRITTRDPHAFEGLEHLQHAAGLYDGGYVFLNMSDLLESAQEYQYDPNIGLANVIKHESIHSFHAESLSDWNGTLYEGMVEYMAEEMNKVEYQQYYGENYAGFVGYDTGDVATAAVLEASLGEYSKFFYSTLVTGNTTLVVGAFDQIFGEGSFSKVNEMPDESAPARFIHFDRVDKILDLSGERAQEIVRIANEHLCDDQGVILRIDSDGIRGTVMASGNFMSGYANGNIDMNTVNNREVRIYYSVPGYSDNNVDVEMNLIDRIFDEQSSLGLTYARPDDVRVGDVSYEDLVRLTIDGIHVK